MDKNITFSYSYSAKENKEIQEIRKKYLSQSESKLDELRRLDNKVQTSGIMESLCTGIGGILVFGLGMCFAMQIIGNGVFQMVFGILLGILGMVSMAVAYPVYLLIFNKTKRRFTPRILELTTELSGE